MVLGIFESIIINGFSAFMPKILQTILSTNPSTAAYLSCTTPKQACCAIDACFLALVILAAAAGVLLGGVVIRKMSLQVPGMLKMIFVCHTVALILIISFMIQCPTREFVGITLSYDQL